MTAGQRICWGGVLGLGVALAATSQQPPAVSLSANPGRPSISTPATLTPVGCLQFQVGYLGAAGSPEFSSQSSINAVVNFSVTSRVELLVSSQPYARSHVESQWTNEPGGVSLGIQGVIHRGEAAKRPPLPSAISTRFMAETRPISISAMPRTTCSSSPAAI